MHSILVQRPRRLRVVLIALLLAVAFGSPSHAFIGDVTFDISPAAPTSAQEILLGIDGVSVPSASVADVDVSGQTITVRIDDTCQGLCPAESFAFDVPVGPLAAGAYTVEVTDVFGTTVASTTFDVSMAELSGLEARAFIEPSDPDDNTPLTVLVTALTCEPVNLVSVTVSGDRVEVRGRIADTGCSSTGSDTSAFSASAGALDAGDYEVVVLLEDAADPGAGFQEAAMRQVRIGDAGDAVALRNGRFQVRVDYRDHSGGTGAGRPVPGASETTTLFSFFERENWELMVKVLDGCSINDHYWVFTAASTDVGYTLEVTDADTGELRTYTNPLGERAPATTDVEAFPCP